MGAPQTLDRDISAPARFQQEMDPALVGRPAGKIGMIGTARAARVGEDEDGFHAVHERLGLGEIGAWGARSEEPTSELPSLMRISYAGFYVKTKEQQAIMRIPCTIISSIQQINVNQRTK